jgi:hypothetical protein
MDDNDDATGSFDFAAMGSLAEIISQMESEEEVRPFTEASTILQDYMDAWVMWQSRPKSEGSEEYHFTDYLFEVVARRAVFITKNIQ